MKSKILTAIAAVSVIGFSSVAQAQVLAGDDPQNGVNSSSVGGELQAPENQYSINLPFGTKRFNSVEVTDQLNTTQVAANNLLSEMASLRYHAENAAGWSLSEQGLGEMIRVREETNAHFAQVVFMATEKDPTLDERLANWAEENGVLNQTDYGSRIARVERVLSIGGFDSLGSFTIPDNSGLMTVSVGDGTNYRCTTEGNLFSTDSNVNENYVVCAAATPGYRDLYKFAFGSYMKGDASVELIEWPVHWENIDYALSIFNIRHDSARNARYYNAIMFGGDHWQGKLASELPTATDEKVVTVNNPSPRSVSAPAPQSVIVVNPADKPVPVKQQ